MTIDLYKTMHRMLSGCNISFGEDYIYVANGMKRYNSCYESLEANLLECESNVPFLLVSFQSQDGEEL